MAGRGWVVVTTDALGLHADGSCLRARVQGFGASGLRLIALLRAVVVIAVVPNSPISAVAGTAYGEVWGLIYVMAGAEYGFSGRTLARL